MRGIAEVHARRAAQTGVGAGGCREAVGFGVYFKPRILKPGCTIEYLGELLDSTDVWAPPPPPPPEATLIVVGEGPWVLDALKLPGVP